MVESINKKNKQLHGDFKIAMKYDAGQHVDEFGMRVKVSK